MTSQKIQVPSHNVVKENCLPSNQKSSLNHLNVKERNTTQQPKTPTEPITSDPIKVIDLNVEGIKGGINSACGGGCC